jgi:hypothetical protein
VYSGSSLLADFNFQAVSVFYTNFTRVSTSEFGFLIHLIGEKIAKKDTAFRKAISIEERLALTLCFLASGDSYVSLQYIFKISHFLPCILLFNFVKMHWVLWAPYYLFYFLKFDQFYDTFLSPLHFTITKTFKKPHNASDSHHSSTQKHQE